MNGGALSPTAMKELRHDLESCVLRGGPVHLRRALIVLSFASHAGTMCFSGATMREVRSVDTT
jgi:hypothetical protein